MTFTPWSQWKVPGVFRAYFRTWEFLGGYGTLIAHASEPSLLRRRLQKIHCTAVYGIGIMYLASHAWSTVTRATRFAPEFVQCLFEDLRMGAMAFSSISILRSQGQFYHLIEFMKKMSTDKKSKPYGTKVMTILMICLLCSFSMVAISVILTCVPLSEEEYNMRRFVYNDRKYPGKVLPTMVKIPGVDETAPRHYEILMCVQLLLAGCYILLLVVVMTLLPLSVVHLEGHYTLLAKEINLLGRPECYLHSQEDDTDGEHWKSMRDMLQPKTEDKRQFNIKKKLEFNYVRRMVNAHQKLLQLQKEMKMFLTPIIMPLFFMNYFCIALGMLKLVLDPSSLSGLRFFRLLSDCCLLVAAYYLNSDASERTDNCNHVVIRAIQESHWYKCDLSSRWSLCLILRRLQRSNKLTFCQGVVVLNRAQFLKVMRVGYSFANTMRLQMK